MLHSMTLQVENGKRPAPVGVCSPPLAIGVRAIFRLPRKHSASPGDQVPRALPPTRKEQAVTGKTLESNLSQLLRDYLTDYYLYVHGHSDCHIRYLM